MLLYHLLPGYGWGRRYAFYKIFVSYPIVTALILGADLSPQVRGTLISGAFSILVTSF